jgi:MinD superfamily P-loop ATPase
MPELNKKTPAERVPVVHDELCLACQRCAARSVCRSKALTQLDPGEPPMVDAARCWGCHVCLPACPAQAITLPQ